MWGRSKSSRRSNNKTSASYLDTLSPEVNRALDQLRSSGIELLRVEVCDINGVSRSKIIPSSQIQQVLSEGSIMCAITVIGFTPAAGVAGGTGFGDKYGYGDSKLVPILDTISPVPWSPRFGRVICEARVPGWDYPSPRVVCSRVMDKMTELGLKPLIGMEYEMYLLNPDTYEGALPGKQYSSTLRNMAKEDFIADVMTLLPQVGVDVIHCHNEYGPGQLETNFLPSFGLAAADTAFTFKTSMKEMAVKHGMHATFMSKPFAGESGSCNHIHVSLWSADTDENVTCDPNAEGGLADRGRWFVGGILAHAHAVTALVAPTVNCYKRYAIGSFAPCSATWGFDNRTVGVRVLKERVEIRLGAGAGNPYYAIAAVLAAGADGIANKTDPGTPKTGNAYLVHGDLTPKELLPTRLEDALEALQKDAVLGEALGQDLVTAFVANKQAEIAELKAMVGEEVYGSDEFMSTVSEAERRYYGDVM